MLAPAPPSDTRLPQIASPRAYITERMRVMRDKMNASPTSSEQNAMPRANSPMRLAWSHTAASSKQRRDEVCKLEHVRKECNSSHFVEYHRELHEKLLANVQETHDKIERAERTKAFRKVAQAMAREWLKAITAHATLKSFRKTLFNGYCAKWKKILIYLLAQRWRKKTQRSLQRCDQLRFNMILRKCIPQMVERIRARRRGGQIPVVRGFLQHCLVANKFSRVLHSFLLNVRRCQRIIRRRRLARTLFATAVKLAMDKAAVQSREERYSGTTLPDIVKMIVATRLVRIDMDATYFEHRNMLDRFVSEVDVADRAETLRHDFYIHCQSIVLQSAMITAFRLPQLVKHTALLQFVKEYDYGKPLSLEQRDRLRRWFVGVYLRMYHRKPYRFDFATTPKGSSMYNLKTTSIPCTSLLRPEGEAAAIADVSEYHLQQWKRWHLLSNKGSVSLPTGALATSKAGGTLGAMAKACPPQLLPFLHDNDLVMMVLGPMSKPTVAKRKQLLSTQNLALLLRMTRESWQSACRQRRNKLDATTTFDSSPQHSPTKSSPRKVDNASLEEKLEADKSFIENLSAQYNDIGIDASNEEVQEVMHLMDFSYLDSFYRRAR